MENYSNILFKGANNKLFEFSRILRKESTDAEDILWQCLRRKQLDGFKFRRQHPLDKYIADFYCHEAKLVVEVDGGIHNNSDNMEYDINRSYELEQLEIKVVRFTNEEVNNNLEAVLQMIKGQLRKQKPPLDPSPQREGAKCKKK